MNNYTENKNSRCFNIFTDETIAGKLLSFHTCIVVLLFIFILTCNLAMVVGLIQTNKTLSLSKKLFICLALSDLTTGLFTVPVQAAAAFQASHASCALIGMQAFLNAFPTSLSMFLLLHISFARYCSVKYANTLICKTQNKLWKYLLLIEILLPCVFGLWYGLSVSQTRNYVEQGAFLMFCSGFVITVLSLILFLNSQLLSSLNQHRRDTQRTLQRAKIQQYHQKVTKTVFYLSVALVLCYLPTIVSFAATSVFVLTKDGRQNYYHYLIPWSFLPLIFNSGLNSFIYISRNKKMKKYLLKCSFLEKNSSVYNSDCQYSQDNYNNSPMFSLTVHRTSTMQLSSIRRSPKTSPMNSPIPKHHLKPQTPLE